VHAIAEDDTVVRASNPDLGGDRPSPVATDPAVRTVFCKIIPDVIVRRESGNCDQGGET
jgi:hypothetical protein